MHWTVAKVNDVTFPKKVFKNVCLNRLLAGKIHFLDEVKHIFNFSKSVINKFLSIGAHLKQPPFILRGC
jgi:hypothetical protein